MTKREIEAIQQLAQSIEHLASMENARFGMDSEEDQAIKDKIRPYMYWFQTEVYRLKALCNACAYGDRYDVQRTLDDIFRFSNH